MSRQTVLYSPEGRFIGLEDADGNILNRQNLDPDSFTGTLTDAEGNVTNLTYNERGNILEQTSPEGGVVKFEYEDPANPDLGTAIVDANGLRQEFTYDSRGNLLSQTMPNGLLVQNDYNATNGLNAVRIYNSSGILMREETAVFDENGNIIANRKANGTSQNITYDTNGNVTSFTDFDERTIRFEYSGNSSLPTLSLIHI